MMILKWKMFDDWGKTWKAVLEPYFLCSGVLRIRNNLRHHVQVVVVIPFGVDECLLFWRQLRNTPTQDD
jgi:hypothetical protein